MGVKKQRGVGVFREKVDVVASRGLGFGVQVGEGKREEGEEAREDEGKNGE